MTAIYTHKDEKYLEEKREDIKKRAEAGEPDAVEKERIWKAIVEVSQGNG